MQPTRYALADNFGDADIGDLFAEISRGVDHQLRHVESHVAME